MDSTGLYYYGARYYDPEVGRFITRDHFLGKKSAPQTLNRYTYALNNPVRYVDLWGNEAVSGGMFTLFAFLGSIPLAGWVILAVVVVAIVIVCAWKWWKDYKRGEIEITDYKKSHGQHQRTKRISKFVMVPKVWSYFAKLEQ